MNESKANLYYKFRRWLGKRKVEKGIAKAESEYMDALVDLCPLAREERIKRLVAYALPGWHAHRNPKESKTVLADETLLAKDWNQEDKDWGHLSAI